MKSKCLFLHGGKCITPEQFSAAQKRLGVKRGDTVLIHAGLGAFGKLPLGTSREDVCQGLIDSFKKSVGPRGTIVMPAFTYSFCKGTAYDCRRSPSEVGPLTEYFRTLQKVIRSPHPIFSVAAYGQKAEDITDVDMDSFGAHSAWAKMKEMNAVFLFVGAPFQTCTFLHYVEQSHKVTYRFFKKFHGTIIDGKRRRAVVATNFVLPLKSALDKCNDPLEKILRRKKLLRGVRVGSGEILAVRAQDVFSEGMRLFSKDQYALTIPRAKRS